MKRSQKVALLGFTCLLLAGIALFVYLSGEPKLASNKPPARDMTHTPTDTLLHQDNDLLNNKPLGRGSADKLTGSNPEESNKGTSIVRFASPAAQAQFIRQNRLDAADIVAVKPLGVYQVKSGGVQATDGVELFTSKRYTAALTPQDTYYNLQWHLGKVNAPATWNNTIGTTAPTVAVIDTGFGLAHEDLDSKWAINYGESGTTDQEGSAPNCTSRSLALDKSCNNLDDDSDGYVDNHTGWDFVTDTNSVQAGDVNPAGNGVSHGTLVSGLIASETNNGQGMSGMSWNSQILPIQALSDDGDGDTLSVALGINYSVTHGAKVINMSLSSDGDDPLVAEQVQYALESGVTVVAAAGNDGVGQLGYPANYPGVIAVGATNSSDVRASFSNYGPNLAIVAPGTGSICTTGWTQAQPNNYYVCGYSGTSFSSPIVAGAASLLLSQNMNLTPAQIKTALTSTATKVAGMNGQSFTSQYGYGRLDVYEALKSVSLPTPRGSCTSHLVSAICEIRAVNTITNQIVSFGKASLSTAASLYQSSLATGLTQGSWLMQMRIEEGGRYSLVREETLVISP